MAVSFPDSCLCWKLQLEKTSGPSLLCKLRNQIQFIAQFFQCHIREVQWCPMMAHTIMREKNMWQSTRNDGHIYEVPSSLIHLDGQSVFWLRDSVEQQLLKWNGWTQSSLSSSVYISHTRRHYDNEGVGINWLFLKSTMRRTISSQTRLSNVQHQFNRVCCLV